MAMAPRAKARALPLASDIPKYLPSLALVTSSARSNQSSPRRIEGYLRGARPLSLATHQGD